MPPRPTAQRVPTVAQVVPGSAVHIVLKEDQPTGRTVHGTVQNILTRGNHPRGIKVRLTDGRVGRVHFMADPGLTPSTVTQGRELATTRFAHTRDIRLDGDVITNGEDMPHHTLGLDAYIRPTKLKKQRHRNNGVDTGKEDAGAFASAVGVVGASNALEEAGSSTLAGQPDTTSVICPVCGAFEGDERAVSHHVTSHFDP